MDEMKSPEEGKDPEENAHTACTTLGQKVELIRSELKLDADLVIKEVVEAAEEELDFSPAGNLKRRVLRIVNELMPRVK